MFTFTTLYSLPIGFAVKGGQSSFDNFKIAPSYTVTNLHTEDFNDGVANGYTPVTGTWSINTSRYRGTIATATDAVSLTPIATFNSGVIAGDIRVVSGNGYVVFDYVNATNFKFAGIDDTANLWIIGDVISGAKVNRAMFAQTLNPNTSYPVKVLLEGATVTLVNSNIIKTRWTFASLTARPVGFGLRGNATCDFDNALIYTEAFPSGSVSTPPAVPVATSTASPADVATLSYASPPFYYNLNDHLGTARITMNQAGVVTSSAEYYPFGELKLATGCAASSQRFTGKLFDNESGLQYFGARYLSIELTRFISVDPAEESFNPENPQSWNRYSYALNNSLIFVDPDGKVVELVGNQQQRQAAFNAIVNSFRDPSAASSFQLQGNKLVSDYTGDNEAAKSILYAVNSKKTVEFALEKTRETDKYGGAFTKNTGNDNSRISLDPSTLPNQTGGVYQNLSTATQHEFGHALGIADGAYKTRSRLKGTNPEALGSENRARRQFRKAATKKFGKDSVAAQSAERVYKDREKHIEMTIPSMYKKTIVITASALIAGWIIELGLSLAYGQIGIVILIGAITYCAYAYLPWLILSFFCSFLRLQNPEKVPSPISFDTWRFAGLPLRVFGSVLIMLSASLVYGFLLHFYSTKVVREHRKPFRPLLISLAIALVTTWVQFLRRPLMELLGSGNWISISTNFVAECLTALQGRLMRIGGFHLPSFQLAGTRMAWEDLVISNVILFWTTFVLILLLFHTFIILRNRFQVDNPNKKSRAASSA